MSDSKKAAIHAGQDFGHALLPAIANIELNLQQIDDDHKLLWWAALFGTLGGFCAASIGPDAVIAIQQMTEKTTTAVIKQHAH